MSNSNPSSESDSTSTSSLGSESDSNLSSSSSNVSLPTMSTMSSLSTMASTSSDSDTSSVTSASSDSSRSSISYVVENSDRELADFIETDANREHSPGGDTNHHSDLGIDVHVDTDLNDFTNTDYAIPGHESMDIDVDMDIDDFINTDHHMYPRSEPESGGDPPSLDEIYMNLDERFVVNPIIEIPDGDFTSFYSELPNPYYVEFINLPYTLSNLESEFAVQNRYQTLPLFMRSKLREMYSLFVTTVEEISKSFWGEFQIAQRENRSLQTLSFVNTTLLIKLNTISNILKYLSEFFMNSIISDDEINDRINTLHQNMLTRIVENHRDLDNPVPVRDLMERFQASIVGNINIELHGSDPLLLKLKRKKIKFFSRFEYDEIVEMAMRFNIPYSYAYRVQSYKDGRALLYKVNMEQSFQLFIYLAISAHGIPMEYLALQLGISKSRVSIVYRGVESILYLLFHHLLEGEHVEMPEHYLRHLKNVSPDTRSPQNNLMRPYTALFIDGTGSFLCKPSDATPGNDTMYSGRSKIHCLRHHVMCDLNCFVWHYSGPYPGSLHDRTLYDRSNLAELLPNFYIDGDYLQAYGDAAYVGIVTTHDQLTCSKKRPPNGELTEEEKKRNQQYSIHRVVIENAFAAPSNFWKGNMVKFRNKLLLCDLEKRMLVTFFLVNVKTLMYRGNRNQRLFSLNDEGKYVNNGLLTLDMYINCITNPEYQNAVRANLRYNLLFAFIDTRVEGQEVVNDDIENQEEDEYEENPVNIIAVETHPQEV